MDAIMKAEGQALQLLEELDAQVIAHLLADPLPHITRQHGHDAAGHRGGHHKGGRDPKGMTHEVNIDLACREQIVGLVHGLTDEARQGQAGQG